MEEPHPGLRAEHPKAVNTDAASRKSSGRSGRRVLIVQADPTAQQLCRQALERAGFLVDAVDSGVAAVMAARESKPDLIVMDLQLRDVAGREAIDWLRSNSALRSTPIVILTTTANADAEPTTVGPSVSLPKPASPAAVQRIVCELLGTLPSSPEE